MILNIYMDDLRPCPDGFILARDAHECLALLRENKGKINYLSLDHDLGDTEDGYWFVKQMIDEGLYASKIYLHTANPVGRKNMLEYMLNAQEHGVLPRYVKIHNNPIIFDKKEEDHV